MVSARLPLAALLAATLLLSCGGSGGTPGASTYEEATERGAYGVGVTTLELVDESRPTDANGDYAGADGRTLVVEVWYPADPASAPPEAVDAPFDDADAPYPLIVFAHGFSSFRRQSATYAQHLASHGYVVAAPDFPLSNIAAPGGPSFRDVVNQPADISFIIDRLLGFSAEDGHLLERAVDGEAIGVTGHSMGGLTTLLTAYGPFRDARVDAAVPIAGPACFLGERTFATEPVPMLVVGGSIDLFVGHSSVQRAFELAPPPRYSAELAGGNHVRFADIDAEDADVIGFVAGRRSERLAEDAAVIADLAGADTSACEGTFAGEPPDDDPLALDRQQELLRAFVTPFFDAYVKGSDEARAFLEDDLPALVPEANTEFLPE